MLGFDDNFFKDILEDETVNVEASHELIIAESDDYKLWTNDKKLELFLLVKHKLTAVDDENVERSEQETAFLAEAIKQRIDSAEILYSSADMEEKIWQALENVDSKTIILQGKSPINGIDGNVVFHFRLEKDLRPQAADDEKIDYREISPFVIASSGDLLAEINLPTEGEPGVDIFNTPIPQIKGKPAPVGLADNVRNNDNKIYAEITGQVSLIDNKINVSPLLIITEDVDYDTGNINFTGSVLIRGTVQAGFSVSATDSIEVDGGMTGAVIAGKDVVLLRGINGGKITAKNSVSAKFIENAEVVAGTDVTVADYIMHSTIRTGRKVSVVGGKGLIVGGSVMAGEELEVRVVGSEVGTITDLQAGVRPELRDELNKVSNELAMLLQTIDKSKKAIKLLKEMEQIKDLPKDKRDLLLTLTKSSFRQEWQREQLIKTKIEIEEKLNDLPRGRIKVRLKAYPGVKLTIGTRTKRLMEEASYALYYLKDNEIRVGILN